MLDIEVGEADAPGVVRLIGELDISTVDRAEAVLRDASRSAERLSLDLSRLSFIDSSGVRLLLQLIKSQRDAGGDATLQSPTPEVARIFEILGLDASGVTIAWGPA
jgi:anti-anti-sigma factor